MLCKLATLLREWFRETDVVARMGGEEFTVPLLDTDLHQAASLAEMFVAHVASTTFGVVGPITISCGISRPISGEDALLTLKRGDRALYRAKTDGRNRMVTIGEEVEA